MPLHYQVLLGAVAGVLVGVVVGESATVLQPIADGFVLLLRMIVAPLVFVTLALAVVGREARASIGRLGAWAVGYNLATLGVALLLGIGLATALGPGEALSAEAREALTAGAGAPPAAAGEARRAVDILLGVIPENVVAALAEGNVLQVLFLAVLFGAAVNSVGRERTRPIIALLASVNDVLYRIVRWIVRLAPFGVFAILAVVVGTAGLTVLGALAWYATVVLIITLIHVLGVHGTLVAVVARQSPRRFLRALREPLPVAFASVSTAAALPVSMETVPRETGITERAAGLVLPLGAAVGRDSSGIYQVASVVTISQLAGQPLDLPALVALWLAAILSSLAVAGVPAASFVNLAILLSAVNLPVGLAALVFAVERPLDHLRTSGNLIGQIANAVFSAAMTREIGPPDGPAIRPSAPGEGEAPA